MMLSENLWLGYNLFLIELYAHLSVGFVLYHVSDLMGNHFYGQTLKCLWKFKDVVVVISVTRGVLQQLYPRGKMSLTFTS